MQGRGERRASGGRAQMAAIYIAILSAAARSAVTTPLLNRQRYMLYLRCLHVADRHVQYMYHPS